MKKIINKKLYNTETAELIARHSNGLSRSDFNYIFEELYRTKKGNWFIHAEGGANTRYSVACGNMQTGSETIIAIDKDEAYQFLEKNGFTDIIEDLFNTNIEEA